MDLSSKKILYLGLCIDGFAKKEYAEHCPLIQVIPKSKACILKKTKDLSEFTHIIFTSPRAVEIFFRTFSKESVQKKEIIAIGPVTRQKILSLRIAPIMPENSTQEGVVALLKTMDLEKTYFLIPRSSIARKKIDEFLTKRKVFFKAIDLYDTVYRKKPLNIDLQNYKEIVFTSPSTVRAFIHIFGSLPNQIKLIAIGPITQKELETRGIKKTDSSIMMHIKPENEE